ncbi:hypothetical protein N656DRAFT_51218 [Canariomyces notabilis]|uniref:Uncharacterized protein n=1 Tax=Canariomyces notabilis TaxID=2074819 RepID=A0AAN6TND2_9PEZI|nr:hypothetical protein N656DRAFT_51218 [Canariomyces arenarius]
MAVKHKSDYRLGFVSLLQPTCCSRTLASWFCYCMLACALPASISAVAGRASLHPTSGICRTYKHSFEKRNSGGVISHEIGELVGETLGWSGINASGSPTCLQQKGTLTTSRPINVSRCLDGKTGPVVALSRAGDLKCHCGPRRTSAPEVAVCTPQRQPFDP